MVPVGRHPKGRNRKTQGGTRLSQTLRKPRRMHRLDSLRRKNSRRKPRPTLSQKGKPRKPSPRTDLSNQGTPAGSIQLRSRRYGGKGQGVDGKHRQVSRPMDIRPMEDIRLRLMLVVKDSHPIRILTMVPIRRLSRLGMTRRDIPIMSRIMASRPNL